MRRKYATLGHWMLPNRISRLVPFTPALLPRSPLSRSNDTGGSGLLCGPPVPAYGRRAEAAKGGHVGGSPPSGYRVEGSGKDARLVEVPVQQAAHAVLLDLEIVWLEEERTLAYNVVFGFDEFGRGEMRTSALGWPDDGMPF